MPMWNRSTKTPIPHYARSDPRNLDAARARLAIIRAQESSERLDPLCLSPEAYIKRREKAFVPVPVTAFLCGDPLPGRVAHARESVPPFLPPPRDARPLRAVKGFPSLPPSARGILALSFDGCRFPLGDPCAAGFHFCGEERLSGKPYCKPHKELCAR